MADRFGYSLFVFPIHEVPGRQDDFSDDSFRLAVIDKSLLDPAVRAGRRFTERINDLRYEFNDAVEVEGAEEYIFAYAECGVSLSRDSVVASGNFEVRELFQTYLEWLDIPDALGGSDVEFGTFYDRLSALLDDNAYNFDGLCIDFASSIRLPVGPYRRYIEYRLRVQPGGVSLYQSGFSRFASL